MPLFQLLTNVPQNKIPSDLPQKICEVISQSLGKRVEDCNAAIIGGVHMKRGNTDEHIVTASLLSIGGLGEEENKRHTKVLSELFSRELGITSDRFVIHFIEGTPSTIGYKGTTCQELMNA